MVLRKIKQEMKEIMSPTPVELHKVCNFSSGSFEMMYSAQATTVKHFL